MWEALVRRRGYTLLRDRFAAATAGDPSERIPSVPRPSSLETLPDEAVENRSAATVVADALREGILHGTLPGGERLRQDAVATRFGVSQMIVREAFKRLVTEGF